MGNKDKSSNSWDPGGLPEADVSLLSTAYWGVGGKVSQELSQADNVDRIHKIPQTQLP